MLGGRGALSKILRERIENDVVLVSHGVIVALLLCAVLGMAPDRMNEFPQANASVRKIYLRGHQIAGVEELP